MIFLNQEKGVFKMNNANKKRHVFDSEDISLFCAQLTLILKSGISVYDGICAINENIKNTAANKVLKQIEEDLEANMPFYMALKNRKVFPEYMVNMIEIGEKSGNLDSVIDSLSAYYSRDKQLKRNIRSAVIYPLILVLMMSVVIAVLVVKVLPIFTQVFNSLGVDIAQSTNTNIAIGTAFVKGLFIIMMLLLFTAFVFYLYSKITGKTALFVKIFSKLHFTRNLMSKIASSRFASAMAMLLSSGYNTDEALEMTSNIITGDDIKERIDICRKNISEGASFAEAAQKTSLFPGIYSQMVSIGVKTGNLDNVMRKLADIYNDEVDISINRAISLIEPCLVGFLSLIIGAILISVMLPLMGIMSSIG